MNNSEEYIVYYYINNKKKEPVKEYINELSKKEQIKVFTYIELLKERNGYLDEPYAKHIKGKVRELRIDFSRNHHRIFYFTFINKKIILLHAFLENTQKTPKQEIDKALDNYKDVLINNKKYE